MARDPPSLLANSELRDISLRPSTISNARITIIHPQLRDLILPVERGRVLYPRGNGIEEVRWKSEYHEERKEEQGEDVPQKVVSGSPKPFVRLNFVPNCLTGSRGMVAAGGQAGELHISHIPPWFEKLPIGQEIPQRHFWNGPDRPPSLNVMLDTRSINNSIVLLPEWPDRWAEQSRKRSTGYIGRRRDNDVRERREVMEDTRERELSEGLDASVDNDDDEAMDLDDDVPDYIQPLSPATYPNTVPFLHAPRIPMAAISSGSSATSRRASSFSHDRVAPDQPATTSRVGRQSFSIPSRSTQPPIRVVSSTPGPSRSASVSSSRHSPSPAPRSVPLVDSDRKRQQASEPRFLISSNDQTIKMFTLRDMPPDLQRSQLSYERSFEASRLDPTRPLSRSTRNIPGSSSNISTDWRDHQFYLDAAMARSGYSPSSLFSRDRGSVSMSAGSAAGSVLPAQGPFRPIHPSIGLDSGLPASQRPPHTQRAALRSPGQAPESGVRATASGKRDERRLKQIGGSHFGSPVNHSSFSPDLRTMVSVGDSTDVHIHEVIDGGRKFRKIATYNAATDSGFSSAWSKDGRKFAVASQDGQVTVWDHRSSRPLAILFTSSTPAPRVRRNPLPEPRLPLWEDVYPGYNHFDSEEEGSSSTGSREGGRVVLVDPITGEPSTGASTSGREAARVVKFSPEGSSRDLMVFSEEGTNIHLVDAKTFTTRVVLPVPLFADAPGNTPPRFTHRTGVEGGECGIAGVAFDPTGDWLYSGTERSVVEWDLRRLGGGEGGTWDMA